MDMVTYRPTQPRGAKLVKKKKKIAPMATQQAAAKTKGPPRLIKSSAKKSL